MKTFPTLILAILISLLLRASLTAAASMPPATQAINALGIDLLRVTGNTNANALFSPYSIQSALAMTYAGAAGVTRNEMKKALHFPDDSAVLHNSFAQLKTQFADEVAASVKSFEVGKEHQERFTPLSLNVANRLYAQRSYDFKPEFFALLKKKYDTSLEQVDFTRSAPTIALDINRWVAQQTQQRIRDLVSKDALNEATRLVLVNALYFKAAWANTFVEGATTSEPFKIRGGSVEEVPTMRRLAKFGYTKIPGGEAVALPYRGNAFQFVILLPAANISLAEFQTKLTDELLQRCASLEKQDITLHLPKFKFEPPTMSLSASLETLGMKSAFDVPIGSADFSGMAVRTRDHLAISDVLHKTFIAVDEQGTEAAAATVVVMVGRGADFQSKKPIEVKVDRPFLFAIQHCASGACLFLGQVVDPRGQ